jgi:polysulfide reductase chain C
MSHGGNNKLEKHYWIWPIACYLFLGGLGGGMICLAGLFDLIANANVDLLMGTQGAISVHYGIPLPGANAVIAGGILAAIVFLGIGTFLLVFELGQPAVFLRTFLSGTAIIKYGACVLVLAMGFGFVYFLFYLPPEWNIIWYQWTWIRDICAWGMTISGLCVMVYTGVFLASMKSKAFWNTPALPVLFTVSALSTASAALAACVPLQEMFVKFAGFWQSGGEALASSLGTVPTELVMQSYVHLLHTIDTVLVLVEIVVLLVYVLMLRGASNLTAKAVAEKWLRGSFAPLFWGGMIVVGTGLPFLFYQAGGIVAEVVAPVFVLAGGLLLRFMIVFSDERRPIPGEKRYWTRLPKGNEKFLEGYVYNGD